MRRREFSLSLWSTAIALPLAAEHVFTSAAEAAHISADDIRRELLPAQNRPTSTVLFLPIGYEGDTFVVAAVDEDGKIATQSVSFDVSVPFGPQIAARVGVPILKKQTFPSVTGAFAAFQGTADFGSEAGVLPYTGVTLDANRAWTAKGVRVAAGGETLTVRTTQGADAPVIVTEWLGFSQADVFLSPALSRLLDQRGINVEQLIDNAVIPNVRQRMIMTREGMTTLQVPSPPLKPETVDMLKTVQIMLWSPAPIAILEREG